ncbi:hypothetical protein KFL_001710170 [Klebsormidium nitens]|uniref:Uncharacterized protein n=1 Tax=Klebsormidium nitens TaxID=105231 RepID=A0A1Y1I5J9_KLENI|nr:hypothetical protein KFL_001710170 [Klebsormidium nitens]|eukprot:GAQ83986.1 hypothetical protein KFL_001710170 [Klebsormidium nitens]
MSLRASVEHKRKEHAKETARRQRQWQDMKRKAEEESARAALDALERRKSERARLANYMREGRAAPKQIHIGREVLRCELGGGDENALPWPEKLPGGGENECRESVPAGVKDRKRVLQAAQHNGRGVGHARSDRKGREENGGSVTSALAGRKVGGVTAEGKTRGGERKVLEDEVARVSEAGRQVGSYSAAEGGSAQGKVLSEATPRHHDKAHGQEDCVSRRQSERATISPRKPWESSGGEKGNVSGGNPPKNREVSGENGTGGAEGVVQRHRRPRWNTRVIQDYETAKMLRARGWERGKESRPVLGRGGESTGKDGSSGFRMYGTEEKTNDTKIGIRGGVGGANRLSARPTLAARESPWLTHEESRENPDPAERPELSTSNPQKVPYSEPATRVERQRRKWSPQETRALASEGSVLMTHSPPGTAGPGGRGDVTNRGDLMTGDVSSRKDVGGGTTSCSGVVEDVGSCANRAAPQLSGLASSDVSGKESANLSGPRGGLRASMQVLQRELAHMHAASSWATSRPVSGSAGSPEIAQANCQTSAQDKIPGVGPFESTREKRDSEAKVAWHSSSGRKEGFGQDHSRQRIAKTVELAEDASSLNAELATQEGLTLGNGEQKCSANGPVEAENRPVEGQKRRIEGETRQIEGEKETVEGEKRPVDAGKRPVEGEKRPVDAGKRPVEGEKRPVGAPERQSLADFLALAVQADRIASREAVLKQRALSAANERRRLTEERRRPMSGERIPECVEILEEVSGGEETKVAERRLSVFSSLEEKGQRSGVKKGSVEPGMKAEVEKNGVAGKARDEDSQNERETAAFGLSDAVHQDDESRADKREISKQVEPGREKGGEKGDLTARLAAEVAALKARLAAKDAEIMRIRRAERVPDGAESTSGRNPKPSMSDHDPIMEVNRTAGSNSEAERKAQAEPQAKRVSGLAPESGAATRREAQREETGVPETDSAPLERGGVSERRKETETMATRRAVVRGGSLAWEFVPPERGSAVNLSANAHRDSADVSSPTMPRAEPEVISAVETDRFYPRPRLDEARLQTPANTWGSQRNRASGAGVEMGLCRGDGESADVIRLPKREVSQDSLCPPRDAPSKLDDVSNPHVARSGAVQGFSTRHVARPSSWRDGSVDVPNPVVPKALRRESLDFPGFEPRPATFSQPEPSISNRVSFSGGRETRTGTFFQGPRVPYALPGESGISAARVWDAFQMSRHQTPSGRRHSDVAPSPAIAYGQRPAYEPVAPQRRHPGDVGMTSAAATGGSHRPPTALSLEEQSILASLQRLDIKLRGLAEVGQSANRTPVRPPCSVASAPIPAPERLHTAQSKLETRSTGANAFGRSAERPAERPPPKVAWQKAKRSRTGVTNGRNEQPRVRGAHRAQLISQPYAKHFPEGGQVASNKGVIFQSPTAIALLSS